MKTIKTIIVDDELEAREGVKLLLEKDSDIEIVGLCKNGIEAIDMINGHEIDLVFLDIQMPVINGFEVVKSLQKERLPYIIFVTAYDQYALKAFEIHAIDYMLKPFTDSRFTESVARAKKLIIQQQSQQKLDKLKSIADQYAQNNDASGQIITSSGHGEDWPRLIVKEKGQVKFILLEDIIWLEAYDYYVKIHLKNEFHLIRESMKKLESRLPSDQFIRIHKSSIINLKYVQSINSGSSSALTIVLSNKKQLNVGRSYKDIVKNNLL